MKFCSPLIKKIKHLLLLILASCSFHTFALDKFAHQLVCQLAYDNLPTIKQQTIDNLLTIIPPIHKKQINQYNHQKANSQITFATACTWADAIKKWSEYDEFKSWHYMNVTRSTQHITATSCLKNCINKAIEIHSQQLQQPSNNWHRSQALLFLGHWLGDIHQPLHVSFASDRGGNQVKIAYQGKCKNLHWYWDECLLKSESLNFQQKMHQLQQLWQDSTLHINLATTEINIQTIANWADESFQLIKQPSFNYCQMKNNRCEPLNKTMTLTKAYEHQYRSVYNLQLLKAAKRLQQLLAQQL